ncbi:MAG: lytic transglycosylase domain-containing protein [Burkholderiales bacterium]
MIFLPISRVGQFVPRALVAVSLAVTMAAAQAGAQREERLSNSVQSALHKAVADTPITRTYFGSESQERVWLGEMSNRLKKKFPDEAQRLDFLKTFHYETTRAGLDPEMVLGLIQVESNFRKYALSTAGARGFMQVMPFWVRQIGSKDHNLFNLRTNLRYGCIILRHYLDIEKGDYFRALGRYNGSLGRVEYPTLVVNAWRNKWTIKVRRADNEISRKRRS